MRIAPNTVVRIASSEPVSLEPDTALPISLVRLVPRFGAERAIPLVDGVFEFPSYQAPDYVTIEWLDSENEVRATSCAEVVSRHYFTLDELRAFGDGQDDFDQLPEEMLAKARQAATEVFEESAHRSFVERIGKTVDYGRARLVWLVHNDVSQVLTEGYRPLSDCQLEHSDAIDREYPVTIEYVYGVSVMPEQVSRAVLELAAYMLRPSNRPTGATGESTDAGYIHFTTAGRDGATDIPEVNAAIAQFGRAERVLW